MKSEDLEKDIKLMLASSQRRNGTAADKLMIDCRISPIRYSQIGLLADKLDMSRASLVERLLNQATDIAWTAAGLDEPGEKSLTAHAKADGPAFGSVVIAAVSPGTDGHGMASLGSTEAARERTTSDDPMVVVFNHLGVDPGGVRRTVAASRDGSVRILCLVSKDYNAGKNILDGENFWFTVYQRQLDDILQAPKSIIAFVCGSSRQIIIVPVADFAKWRAYLPPYTQGKEGWHVQLAHSSGTWALRRRGRGTSPIDVSSYAVDG